MSHKECLYAKTFEYLFIFLNMELQRHECIDFMKR